MTAVRIATGQDASISGVDFTAKRWSMRKGAPAINYTGYSDTTQVTVAGDSSALIRIVGVLSTTQSPDDLKGEISVTATSYSGKAYTQAVKVRSVSEDYEKGDDGAREGVIVIEGVIEDMTSGSFLNPA